MKQLVIIDINNFIYRAYFGIQQRLTAPDGTPVNAVYGVFNMLHRLLVSSNPSSVIIAKDSKASLRKDLYPQYKENRSRMPEDLVVQLPLIYKMLEQLNLPCLEASGYEADDIIYSLVSLFEPSFDNLLIASGDKDLMQLVSEKVHCIDTMKDKTYDTNGVKEKFGLAPNQILDFLALLGDSSDNIPGVTGIGEKTAVKLILQFGSLDNIYLNLTDIKGKLKTNLEEQKDKAYLSYELAKLKSIPNFTPELTPFVLKNYKPELKAFFESLNMRTSIQKLDALG